MVTKKVVNDLNNPIVKKVAKKSPIKKTSASKSITKIPLVVAREEYFFWTSNGSVLGNLKELELALQKMSDDVYKHHVTKDKNDFASWVGAILKDKECAEDLKKAKTAKGAKLVVTRHLKKYI
jgi:hypothetical protein